jgi:hypothetical protein
MAAKPLMSRNGSDERLNIVAMFLQVFRQLLFLWCHQRFLFRVAT